MLIRLTIVCLAILMAGCMATGPRFQRVEPPPENKATIYIFRKSNLFSYGGAFPDIKIDGVGEYGLKNSGYLRFEVEPGKHQIEIISKLQLSTLITWPYREITVEVTAGSTHYVMYDVWNEGHQANTTLLQTAFSELTESAALTILSQTKRIQ